MTNVRIRLRMLTGWLGDSSGLRRRKEKPVALEGKWELLGEVRELSEALAGKKKEGMKPAFLGASLFSIRRELEQPLGSGDIERIRKELEGLRKRLSSLK